MKEDKLGEAINAVLRAHADQISLTDTSAVGTDIRFAIAGSLEEFSAAMVTACIRNRHRGSRAETATSYAKACASCQQLLRGVAQATALVRP